MGPYTNPLWSQMAVHHSKKLVKTAATANAAGSRSVIRLCGTVRKSQGKNKSSSSNSLNQQVESVR